MFWTKFVAAIVLCFFLAGCSGYKQYNRPEFVDWPPRGFGAVPFEVGSSIVLVTTPGTRIRGKVDSMDEAFIVVDGQSVSLSQIDSIEVRSFLWAPTTAFVFTAAAAGLVFLSPQGHFEVDADTK